MIAQPCELVVKTVIPSIRAMVAKELVLGMKMRQVEAARLLGVTQAAVSQYLRGNRGGILRLDQVPEIVDIVRRLATGMAAGDLTQEQTTLLVCEACYTVRKKGIFCGENVPARDKYYDIAQTVCLYDSLREKLFGEAHP